MNLKPALPIYFAGIFLLIPTLFSQDAGETSGHFDPKKAVEAIPDEELAKRGTRPNVEQHVPLPIPIYREPVRRALSDADLVTHDLRTQQSMTIDHANIPDWEMDQVPGVEPGLPGDFLSELAAGGANGAFTGFTLISDPSAFPWRMNVKVFFSNANGDFVCSGALIHPRYVITAGHCVYSHTNNVGFADSMTVAPAYNFDFSEEFGVANAVLFTTFNGWVQNENSDFDMAIVELDRPVGSVTGTFGYGWNSSNSFYVGRTFNNPGYPADPPFSGETQQFRSGTYDTILTERFEFTPAGSGGHSGSGSYYLDNDSRFIHATHSYSTTDNMSGHVRMTQAKFNVFQTAIAGTTPSSPDLQILAMTASPETIEAGDQFSSVQYLVYNNSSSSFNGTVNVDLYLSTNDFISTFDTYLQTRTWTGSLPANASILLTGTSNPPTVPSNVSTGLYFLGGIITNNDSDTSNNFTRADDVQDVFVLASAPPNDNWANSILLPLASNIVADNNGATTQTNEQNLASPPTGSTVWWNFVAPSTGSLTIDTFGSNFDTVLHVFSDFQQGFGNFTLVASNDDAVGLQSEVMFDVVAGERYEVRVGGFSGAQGNIQLNSTDVAGSGPPNDNYFGPLLSIPFMEVGTNINATTEPGEPELDITGATVWWFILPDQEGTFRIDTFGSDYDTVLHIFTGFPAPLPDLTLVAFNDDSGSLQSEVTFPVMAGECYDIRVGGYFGAMGNIQLSGDYLPGILLGDVNGDGVINLLDVDPFVTVLTNGGFQAEADINMDGIVNLLDISPFIEILTGS